MTREKYVNPWKRRTKILKQRVLNVLEYAGVPITKKIEFSNIVAFSGQYMSPSYEAPEWAVILATALTTPLMIRNARTNITLRKALLAAVALGAKAPLVKASTLRGRKKR